MYVPTCLLPSFNRNKAEGIIGGYYFRPQIDDVRFEQFSGFLIRLWNRAYEIPEKELKENVSKRVITSLEPLNRTLGIFFDNEDPTVQPKVWNVINWWLQPPDTVDFLKPADSWPWEKCWGELGVLEENLRNSNHALDVEKANIVQIWLLEWEKRKQSKRQLEQAEKITNCLVQLNQFEKQVLQLLRNVLEKNEPDSHYLRRLRQIQQPHPQLWEWLSEQLMP
jgi:hypothetical protein